ncbi:MAG: cell division protein FtsL [Myxococcota bacterium]
MKARFLLLWAVAVLSTGSAFVVHLALRFETVRLGYEVGEARREQRRLIEQQRLLAIEAATLRQTDRIEYIARYGLGMDVPTAARVVPMDPKRQRRTAGSVR